MSRFSSDCTLVTRVNNRCSSDIVASPSYTLRRSYLHSTWNGISTTYFLSSTFFLQLSLPFPPIILICRFKKLGIFIVCLDFNLSINHRNLWKSLCTIPISNHSHSYFKFFFNSRRSDQIQWYHVSCPSCVDYKFFVYLCWITISPNIYLWKRISYWHYNCL